MSHYLHEFRVETSVFVNIPSESWGSGKYSNCSLYRFLSNIPLLMHRNNTLDFIHQDLNLKCYTERVWFKKILFNFASNECPNSSKIEKMVVSLFSSRFFYSNVSVTIGSIAYIEVLIGQNIIENLT